MVRPNPTVLRIPMSARRSVPRPPKPAPTPVPKPAPNPAPNPGIVKALFVGINYIEDPRNRLNGCINDIKHIEKKIRASYPACKEFRSLSDDQSDPLKKPTRQNILAGIAWLTTGLKPGDSVFFQYSGHGGLTIDRSGDETSGYDSCIYPIRNRTIESILDDELRELLVQKVPANCKCFAVLDCCHSGTAFDARYNYNAPSYGTLTFTQNNKYPSTSGSVIMLSGCKDTQTAADTVDANNVPSGALTNALLTVWGGYGMNIKFKHLLWDVRAVLQSGGYSQIPQLSCSSNVTLNDVFQL